MEVFMANLTWTFNGKKLPWPPKPFPGPLGPMWEMKQIYIKEFVSRNKLSPAKQEIQVDRKVSPVPPWWKYGGPFGPHIHLGNDIYLLNKEQWQDFSKGMIKEMDLKLNGAKSVSFESLMKASVETELSRSAK
jgi:hypothetical protein